MFSRNPKFRRTPIAIQPIGNITHAIPDCPRCHGNIGVNRGMLAGVESIICTGRKRDGARCGGHYYWHARESALEFIGTK
jgi:hypothetical protein